MTSGPRALLVDCAGTLLRPDPSVARQYRSEARRLTGEGSLPDLSAVRSRFHTVFNRPGLPDGTMRYGTTHAEGYFFWKRIVAAVFPTLDEEPLEVLTKRLFERFSRPSAWAVRTGAREVLGSLREAGVRTALVSNWDRRGPRLLERMNLASFFNAVVFSSRVGVEKPDPEIFREALRRLSVAAERAAVLGNTPSRDLTPAQRLGLRAYHFDGDGDHGPWKGVRRWAELPGMLGVD